jgi:hypothetical protein
MQAQRCALLVLGVGWGLRARGCGHGGAVRSGEGDTVLRCCVHVAARPSAPAVKFLVAKVVRLELPGGRERYMALEKMLKGMAMYKLTNNYKYIAATAPGTSGAGAGSAVMGSLADKVATAIAFSHYTHSATQGYLLVCGACQLNV